MLKYLMSDINGKILLFYSLIILVVLSLQLCFCLNNFVKTGITDQFIGLF